MERIIILSLLFSSFFLGQSNELEKRNSDLEKLRREILNIRKNLNSLDKKESGSVKALEQYEQEEHAINLFINNLSLKQRILEKKIKIYSDSVNLINIKSSKIREEYSNYIVWQYKSRYKTDLQYILESGSLSKSIQMLKYLKIISAANEKRLAILEEIRIKTEKLRNQQLVFYNENKKTINEKEKEKLLLDKSKEKQRNIIAELRKDKKELRKDLSKKEKAQEEIKLIIAKLISAEGKNTDPTNRYTDYVTRFDYGSLNDFKSLKGKLNWPVSRGNIVRKFGKNKNQKLNTVTLNYGIDIQTKGEQDIYAVADGYVSAIEWIPGFGSIIILNHKSEYRTVYGNIGDIQVEQGEKIKAGTKLGVVNNSIEGNVLHFEIWQSRNNHNPEIWLARK